MLPNIHIEIERWKYNKELNCWVSNFGNIRDKNKKPIKVFIDNKKGYCNIVIDKRVIKLHRLVLETWKGKSSLTIDHLDHNKRNNKLSNLEYVSKQENEKRAKDDLLNTREEYKRYTFEGHNQIFSSNKALINYCKCCINGNVKKLYNNEQILEQIRLSSINGNEFLGKKWIQC